MLANATVIDRRYNKVVSRGSRDSPSFCRFSAAQLVWGGSQLSSRPRVLPERLYFGIEVEQPASLRPVRNRAARRSPADLLSTHSCCPSALATSIDVPHFAIHR